MASATIRICFMHAERVMKQKRLSWLCQTPQGAVSRVSSAVPPDGRIETLNDAGKSWF